MIIFAFSNKHTTSSGSNYRPNKILQILLFSIALLFLSGCATSNSKLEVQSADKIEPKPISQFTLGPGDVIDVFIWRHNELSKRIKVDPNGKIFYPLVGEIEVSGKSVNDVQEIVTERLSKHYTKPVVNINVISIRSQNVFVLGEVSKPGIFPIDRPISVLESISLSGGFTQDAKKENVLIARTSTSPGQLIKLDLESVMKNGDMQQNIVLREGDIVFVPALIIADVARYARYISDILRPILQIESAIVLGDEVNRVIEGTRGEVNNRTFIIQSNP